MNTVFFERSVFPHKRQIPVGFPYKPRVWINLQSQPDAKSRGDMFFCCIFSMCQVVQDPFLKSWFSSLLWRVDINSKICSNKRLSKKNISQNVSCHETCVKTQKYVPNEWPQQRPNEWPQQGPTNEWAQQGPTNEWAQQGPTNEWAQQGPNESPLGINRGFV